MRIFNLPDLGEGLAEAEIHEWHVKVGETVKTDQPMLSVETAKAVVDVPAPYDGVIAKQFGEAGDIIPTDSPLVGFEGEAEGAENSNDAGTVVGQVSNEVIELDDEPAAHKTAETQPSKRAAKVPPPVRALARRLGVDLATVAGTGPNGAITKEDVEAAGGGSSESKATPAASVLDPNQMEKLRGVRRTMAQAMTTAHREVACVTLMDDADIHAWPAGTDITCRVIRAIVVACEKEPALNAWYDGKANARQLQTDVHLGLALDAGDGLFVPVIKSANTCSPESLREHVNRFKAQVKTREIPQEDLQGNTITLSNFGVFAGRYANPVVVPPTVAILGTGRIINSPVVEGDQLVAHRLMPLSLSFDHRAATGGEAARFLAAVIEDLSRAD